MLLDALLKLRQICCHPQLLQMDSAKEIKTSAKMEQLLEMIPAMIEEGRKIVIFSQFVSMIALIEAELKVLKLPYAKIVGDTKHRLKEIEDFQQGKVNLFVISIKAGGTGINLTAADTVIHFDPWWNPAVEQQATDRVHRIGQDKPVFVYKMIICSSVEEKILAMQARKAKLAEAIFDVEKSSTAQITVEDINNLFAPLSSEALS
jgi:SNF2 family DNA or RNA helicase